MEQRRRNFQGVINILSFNRHFYVFGLCALAMVIASKLFIGWSGLLYQIVILAFVYGLIMPLLVSAYVYDFSGFYSFKWLTKLDIEDTNEKFNLNINAGFDETSFILRHNLPKSQLQVFDFYNPDNHTEAAIVRARKVSAIYPNTKAISTSLIPLPDNAVDNIFLLSSLHEIREYNEKVRFLKECRRVCKPGGSIVMVEHLRDFPNFMAFTVGFTHFFSKTTWSKAFNEAGFGSIKETKFTPFMSIFYCR